MPDPTIPELLRAAFKIEQKWSEEDPVTLHWPDDTDGQGQCIHHLAEMATNPALPYEMQAWAYDKLEEIARDYQKKGELSSVPLEMFVWCFAVVSKGIERPKRERGRPGAQFAFRNRMIGDLIRWLRHRGETREAAIEQVAEAIGPFGVSPETVKTVLRQETEPDPETVARRERLFREYVAFCRQRNEPSQADIEGMKAVAAAMGVPPETVETILGRGDKIE